MYFLKADGMWNALVRLKRWVVESFFGPKNHGCLLKWISDTVLSNFRCHANLADTAAKLVHNTKKLVNVKLYY